MRQECHKQEGQLVETSQSYNPEVRYKYRTALCNNYSVLSEKRGRLGASRRCLGREFQVTGPMYEKARFPYLLSLMRGSVIRPASAER